MIKKLFSIPGLITLFLILGVAYIGLWMALRSTVVSGVTNMITELERDGYRVEHGGLSIDGFPFSIDARSPNVIIRTTPDSAAASMGNWSVDANDIDLYAPTLTPLSWTISHRGQMRVDMRVKEGDRYMFDVSPANIDVDVTYSLSGKLKKLHTDISRIQLNPLLGAEPAVLGLAGLRADMDVKKGTGMIDFLAKDIVMSQQALDVVYGVLGQNISRLALKGEIENWSLIELEGMDAWLQSPAKIKSEDWQLLWGDADIVGSFAIGFENNLPEGVVRFRVKNVNALMDHLIDMNLIDGSFSEQINGLIASIEPDEDGRQSIEITIRDGVVKYGFFTLFRL